MPTGIRTENLIGGDWVDDGDGTGIMVRDPATGKQIAEVPNTGVTGVRRALQSAKEAYGSWATAAADTRADIMMRVADLVEDSSDSLARLITSESGKPIAESVGEVAVSAEFFRCSAEEARRLRGEILSTTAEGHVAVVSRPRGIAASITPWNFPLALLARKIGPALSAGCPMIAKPAETAPLSGLALAEILVKAGVPSGAVSILTGTPSPIADTLLAEPEVRIISFTGSVAVGRELISKSAGNVTRLSLELGGHAPFIVYDDADIDLAVETARIVKFRNSGQTCISPNRFLVHEKVYGYFMEKFCAASSEIAVGRGTDPGVTMGPLISESVAEKVDRHVRDAVSKGSVLRNGGSFLRPGPELAGYFYEPTVLEHWDSDMLLSKEETFGPVAAVRRFRTDEEALNLANASSYGLAGYAFTGRPRRVFELMESLECGILCINNGKTALPHAPLGGSKLSGYGREGGKYGVEEYLDLKYVNWSP